MDCVVSPVDQVLPVAEEEVSSTLPPWQKVNVPVTVTVGLAGLAIIVVVIAFDGSELQPPLTTTV